MIHFESIQNMQRFQHLFIEHFQRSPTGWVALLRNETGASILLLSNRQIVALALITKEIAGEFGIITTEIMVTEMLITTMRTSTNFVLRRYNP